MLRYEAWVKISIRCCKLGQDLTSDSELIKNKNPSRFSATTMLSRSSFTTKAWTNLVRTPQRSDTKTKVKATLTLVRSRSWRSTPSGPFTVLTMPWSAIHCSIPRNRDLPQAAILSKLKAAQILSPTPLKWTLRGPPMPPPKARANFQAAILVKEVCGNLTVFLSGLKRYRQSWASKICVKRSCPVCTTTLEMPAWTS